jgi:3-keto-L-gulonate-6-phosphate decarboxylase
MLWQDLQRHSPAQRLIVGRVDLAHAPFSEQGHDPVVTERGADRQFQNETPRGAGREVAIVAGLAVAVTGGVTPAA